jgi:hypothetical protein
MIAAAFVSSAIAFSPAAAAGSVVQRNAPQVAMSAPLVNRREMLSFAGAAVVATGTPMAALADGATSKATRERARQIYGSRIFRVQGGSAEAILAEENAFAIFITGAYGGLVKAKPVTDELKKLKKTALAAAKKGDSGAAQAAVKDFVKIGEISEQDTVQGGNYDPKQRRNPGAPPTSEIEAQMGTSAYALYRPLK